MATNIELINQNIINFYDFSNKDVIHVGAGGGQLIEYSKKTKRVLAIDSDIKAVETLMTKIENSGLNNISVEINDFFEVDAVGDLVLFEFCLHEIDRPYDALLKALKMAGNALIIDHSPESRWAWYAAETEKATKSWGAVDRFDILKTEHYLTEQRFADYPELYERLKVLGEPSLSRISGYKKSSNIKIEMSYKLALIEKPA